MDMHKPAEKAKRDFARVVVTGIMLAVGLSFIYPVVFTLADSFMADWEISEYYGAREGLADSSASDGKAVNLKLIPYEVTLEQYYTTLIDRPQYMFMFWNSIKLALPIVVGQLIVAAMAAYAFTLLKTKLMEALYFLYIVVMLLPFQVTLVPNYIISDRLGILNTGLSVILPGIFGTFGVFLLKQYMVSIPLSCIEAAKIDGAGHFRVFLDIVLPLMKPGLAALFVLLFIDNWNMVEQPLIFLSDPLKEPLSIFLSYINVEEPGIAFAASFFYMVPMILVFLHGEEHMVTGMGIQMPVEKG